MVSEGSERELTAEAALADETTLEDTYPAPEARETGRAIREDGQARQGSDFDPTPYIRQLRGRGGGSDYLDVKWRLLWLRKEHPDAEIITELVQHDPQMAIFKATVTLPSGGKATGYGSETASDFPDFIEKAETKAIGRALNALGYGAQFSERSDDPALNRGGGRADVATTPAPRPVPLPRRETRGEQRSEVKSEAPSRPAPVNAPSPATSDPELVDYSWSAFWPWARERGLNGPKAIETLLGRPVAGLAPAELRDLIVAADSQR